MKFTVKTRQHGKLETLEIEANDRQALWKVLDERGIQSVVSVSEGGSETGRSVSISPQVRRGLLAGLLIVAAAVGFMMLFNGGEQTSRSSEKAQRSRQIQEAEGQSYPAARTAPTPAADADKEKSKAKKNSFFVRVEKLPDGNEKRWTAKGECYYVDLKRSREPGKPIYTNDVESVLAMYAHPGEDMPPPPDDDISDEEALAACSIPIYAFPDDSDAILDEREVVNELKQDLKKYIEEGGHARDYIRELIDRQNSEAQYVSETREKVEELIRTDDCLLAAKFLKEMNGRLAEKGIPPVRLSEDYQSVLEAAEAAADAEKGTTK